ncbi:MAG: hypothetical protein AB9891_12680 [Anaerolineaceae bacterium]
MHRIIVNKKSYNKKSYQITENDLLNAVEHLSKGYIVLADMYYKNQLSGFADWKNAFLFPDVGQEEYEKALVDQIENNEFQSNYDSLTKQIRKIKEIDRRIIQWLGEYVGLPSVQKKNDILTLDRRLQKIITKGPNGYYQGPVWAMDPEYQKFVKETEEVVNALNDVVDKIIQIISDIRLKKGI